MNELMNGYSCVNTEFSLCQAWPGQAAYGHLFPLFPSPNPPPSFSPTPVWLEPKAVPSPTQQTFIHPEWLYPIRSWQMAKDDWEKLLCTHRNNSLHLKKVLEAPGLAQRPGCVSSWTLHPTAGQQHSAHCTDEESEVQSAQ